MKKLLPLFLILLFGVQLFGHNDIQNGYHFTVNNGQFNNRVRFYSRLKIGNMFLEKGRFTFDLYSGFELDSLANIKSAGANKEEKNGLPVINQRQHGASTTALKKHSYAMSFEDYNPNVMVGSSGQIKGVKNYFIGNDQSKWVTNVPSFKSVNYTNLYDNIDMEVYTSFDWMKYDIKINPGGNPNDISILYEGVKSLSLEGKDLVVKLSTGEVREVKLHAYQNIDGRQVTVSCNYKLNGNQLRFEFPDGYDSAQQLVIDPVWIFSTLTGSTADNWGFTSTYDSQGNLYAAGIAFATGYPTTLGAYDATFNGGGVGGGFDISITKYNATGTSLIYSTYLGGSDVEAPHSLVNDSQDNLILLGTSSSTDFPIVGAAYDPTFNSGWAGTYANMWGYQYTNGVDIILAKFDITGALTASTYIGGSDNEGLNESMVYNYSDQIRGEVVLDNNDNIYVCTSLWSDDFPVTNGSVINNGAGWGRQDAVVFKMDGNFTTLNWSTYLGGSDYDAGYSIRYSQTGEVFVCGGTTSTDIGAGATTIGPSFSGIWDGYIASFNATTGAAVARTYLGTSSYDQAFILEIDINGDVYTVGQSLGTYPIFNATFSNTGSKQFIHKMSPDLTTSIYSTVFGSGSATVNISPTAFLVDNCGNVYVSGWGGGFNSASSIYAYNPQAGGNVNSMPLTFDAIQSTTDGADFYFFVMERDAQSLLYGTYFGDATTAEHTDGGTSRFDPNGIVYQSVCAACGTGLFPTTPGVWSTTSGAGTGCNMGAIKFDMNFQGIQASATVPANITLCSTDYTVNFTSSGSTPMQEWIFGDGGTDTAQNPTYTYSDTGQYVVTFIAIDSSSCNIRDTAYFSVDLIQAPTFNASFNLPVIPPCSDPASVTVDATITGTGIDSTQWNMGDGTIYTDSTSISYSYTTQGIYPIEVIAWDLTCNVSDTIRDTLNFLTAISTATATAPADTTLCSSPPYNMNFTSNGSTPYVYWDFGNGNNSTAANPSNVYADSGAYQVMFVAIDSMTCNVADTVYFNVTLNQAATFNASFNLPVIPPCSDPASVTVNATITGTGIDSTQWDMGDGTIYADSTSISYSYTTQGLYPIEVIAWDLTCNFSDTIRDTLNFITNLSTATATAPSDTTLCSSPPYNMNFTSNGSTPYVYWDFGNGNNSTATNPSNVYADSGAYQVMFIAIDSMTCNIADTVYFNVQLNQAAVFSATIDVPTIPPCTDPLLTPLTASFTGSGADSLSWDLGDGTIYADSTSFTYYYSTPGVYTVTMTAWDFVCNNTNTVSQIVDFNSTFSTATATAPADTTLCSSPPFNMNFTSNGSTPDVFWDFGDGSTSTLPNPSNSYADSGSYQVMFVAIDSSTCNIADTVYFNVGLIQNEVLTSVFNLPVIDPCTNPDSILVQLSFTGTGADSIHWDMGNGVTFEDSISINYYYTSQGTYPISMTAYDFACNNTATALDTVFFVIDSTNAVATAPNDTTLCSLPPYNMSFTSDGSTPDVFWSFGDGNTSTLQNPSNSYADSGSYQVMYVAIDSNTCNIADTVYFNVGLIQAPSFVAGFNLPTIPPCSDPASVTVNASFSGAGADSLVWDMGDGTFIYDSTNISYNYSNQGIYTIVVTAWDFCGNDTSITATFNFLTDISTAVANAPTDTILCTSPPFSISFSSGGTTPNQIWDFGDGTTSTQANPTHIYSDSGNYVVTYIAIDSNTCNVADTAIFNVGLIQAEQFSAELSFTPPPPCGSDSMLVQLNFTGTAADSIIWDMGNGDVFNSTSLDYYYTEAGIYNLTLTAFDFTCNLTEVISNEVPFYGNISTDVIIPNVFTPNGDGENDLLKFVNVDGSQSFAITIWNRWGRKVFVSNDPLDHWDGISMKDKTIHEGVYYFEILFTDVCSDEEQIKTGFVHLMR